MEREWTDSKDMNSSFRKNYSEFDEAVAFVLLPLAIPLLVIAFAVGLVVLAFRPIRALWNWFQDMDKQKREAINKEYEECMKTVRKTVTDQLTNNAGSILTKLIDKVTVIELPRRIGAFEELIKQFQRSRREIIAKRHMLKSLSSQIMEMSETILKFRKELNQTE